MDETKNTTAIILNRSDYRESDSLVIVYTRDYGKLTLRARGTKKIQSKLAGHIEPISLANILIIKGKGFDYVGSALTLNAYPELKNNLNKIYFAGRAIRWFNRLVKEAVPDEKLFIILSVWLEALENFKSEEFTKENGEIFFAFFALKLLSELGYKPEMYKCLNCRNKIAAGKNYFNLRNGGLICENCYNKQRFNDEQSHNELLIISDNCVKIIRFIIDENIDKTVRLKIDKKLIKELSLIINSFLAYRD